MFEPSEVAVTFYRLLKKNSYSYEERVVNESSELRRSIIEQTKKDIKDVYSGISEKNLEDAISYLATRISL